VGYVQLIEGPFEEKLDSLGMPDVSSELYCISVALIALLVRAIFKGKCVCVCACFTAVATGVDWSTGAEERRSGSEDALRVWQPGAGASVAAAGGIDTGWLKHDAVSVANQSAYEA